MINNIYIDEFPQEDSLIYFNHATVSPWPQRCRQAINAFAAENVRQGARDYPRWIAREHDLKCKFQALLNAPSSNDIALLKNTSEALSMVAHGLDWQPGDNVVLIQQEFPSNRIVWQSLQSRGVEVRLLDMDAVAEAQLETALLALSDVKTRLLSVSSVQYARGLRIDLTKLGHFCHENDILFCVDAIQSLGVLSMDVQAIQADFVMADGHKWMMGPEGLAVFYARPEARDRLQLHQYGWHMVESMEDFDSLEWSVAASARRFECGSPNMLGIYALDASLSLLLEIGIDTISQQVLSLCGYLRTQIRQHPDLELLSSTDESRQSGIVTFRHTRIASEQLQRCLMDDWVVCAARGGGIRFSPHFYNSKQQCDDALQRLEQCCK